jgi:cytosine deaminase
MLTDRPARLLNCKDYGFAIGGPADIVVFGALTPEHAVAEIAQPLAAFKNGRQTVEWKLPTLMQP